MPNGATKPFARAATARRSVIIAQLLELLDARQDRSLRMAEICAATGMPERTLREYSIGHFGMSLSRYMWLRRMNLAHEALLNADPTSTNVTRVAVKFGFTELGRFSVKYRAMFGTSPMESLGQKSIGGGRAGSLSVPRPA